MSEKQSEVAIADLIESFIRHHFTVREDDFRFGRDINLWEEGYIDSTGIIEVVAFAEEQFSVILPEETLSSSDFLTIHGISKAVALAREVSVSGHETVREVANA